MNMRRDTIAAIATPPGIGGVGIIRVSGPDVSKVAQALLSKLPKPRLASFENFANASGEILDQGLALYFKAPHSFTGEDVLELQGHGGSVILDQVLQAVIQAGARLAEPGEFSKRAFLNDKIDLLQAEAIADLIASQSQAAAQAAMRSLTGEFSQRVNTIVQALVELRMYVEAAIDFPEEEIDFLSDGHVLQKLIDIKNFTHALEQQAQQGSILREGITIVIAGQPNAGKSSLLNALAGREAAIVTPIAGTTRDIVREHILCDGIPLHVLDTAGLRDSDDPVEQEGIRRAHQAISQAQGVLLVVDASTANDESIHAQMQSIKELISDGIPIILVLNKMDLLEGSPKDNHVLEILRYAQDDMVRISALTQQGIDRLKTELKKLAGVQSNLEGCFLARRRHLDAIARAKTFIAKAQEQLIEHKAGELLAEDLRYAQQALSEITGAFTADDLLGKIFGSFCIGK